MKKGVIIQARMGSSRLPGKIMKDLFGKPVLQRVIERVQQCRNVDEIIIATTNLLQDDIIIDQARICDVAWFRGSEDDVLSRYYLAAKENKLETIIRITSDCPLIDPIVTDDIIEHFMLNEYDLVTNAGIDLSQRTYPRGLDTEVFSFSMVEKAFGEAQKSYQREHVTPYIYENSNNIYYFKNKIDYSMYRWTLDTDDDFRMIYAVYQSLYKGKHDFFMNDIIDLLVQYPEISKINQHIEQKKML